MRKISILLILLSFISCETTLFDDENILYIKISGTVVDDDTRDPIQGASVEINGSKDSDCDTTDEKGRYSVSIPYKTISDDTVINSTVIFLVTQEGYEGYADAFQADSVPAEIDVRLIKD